MTQSTTEISKGWQRKFALIEKAGGVELPNVKSLSMGERMTVNFNILGFLLGPFYDLAKGMWKKGLALFGITLVALVVLDALFSGVKLADNLSVLLGPVLFATQANTDYYKKVVLGINKWW